MSWCNDLLLWLLRVCNEIYSFSLVILIVIVEMDPLIGVEDPLCWSFHCLVHVPYRSMMNTVLLERIRLDIVLLSQEWDIVDRDLLFRSISSVECGPG